MEYERLYADMMLKLKEGLSPNLYYHGLHHTIDVLSALTQISKHENISGTPLLLLKTAALLHDSGFTETYKDHEEAGCRITRTMLPNYGYSAEDIDIVCGMIMATKIPQTPDNKLEEIICDADLDYLGRDDFYHISHTLFKELVFRGVLTDENEWNKIQVRFLSAHHYFTATCQNMREANKQQRIEEIKKIVKD